MKRSPKIFSDDDYDKINKEYFEDLRSKGELLCDPSGWLDTYSRAASIFPDVPLSRESLAPYCLDEGNALGDMKLKIAGLVSSWEGGRDLSVDEFTLCHSVSTATLTILVLLKRLGIKSVIFETPAYAVTVNQTKYLGLRARLIPTYLESEFRAPITEDLVRRNSPCAIWLTQPRMSLGYDQPVDYIAALRCLLSPQDFLVIDEATEQHFPSHLRHIGSDRNVLRTRGFLKGAGLNGIRLAFILHHDLLRDQIEATQEVTGSSLEVYSLRAAVEIAEKDGKLAEMLRLSNSQTTSLRERAEKVAFGSKLKVSRLVNGYIGSFFLDLSSLSGTHEEKRQKFLSFCRSKKMPVILGSGMRFAYSPGREFVRANYYNRDFHILWGVSNMVDFLS